MVSTGRNNWLGSDWRICTVWSSLLTTASPGSLAAGSSPNTATPNPAMELTFDRNQPIGAAPDTDFARAKVYTPSPSEAEFDVLTVGFRTI